MKGHLHHHHIHQQQSIRHISVHVDTGDRFPQWSIQETKEFLMIRAELNRTFMETKRNKLLWEVISNKMKEMGYNRSPEQCKCKWKNLVTRYKGCQTMEPEAMMQQFPFYKEIQAIFAARIQRMLCAEAGGGGGSSGTKKKTTQLSSDEEGENEESEGERGSSIKKKSKKIKSNNSGKILEDFMKQQMKMEKQWREDCEAKERERRKKEMEWREAMKALENERIVMERRWREREDERRMREESKAEKRDALITALLNKLRREDI